MKKHLSLVLTLLLLSGCIVTIENKPVREKTNFEIINESYNSKEKVIDAMAEHSGDKFYTYFFKLSRDFIEHQRLAFSGGIPNTLRLGYFDLSDHHNKKTYKDSNYYYQSKLFTTTYRPKSLYGNEFNNYIAYCPVFYNWENREQIKQYIEKIVSVYKETEISDVVNYITSVQFSHCVAINEKYHNRFTFIQEKDYDNIADMYAIAYNTWKKREDFNNVFVNNREFLHGKRMRKNESIKKWSKLLIRENMNHVNNSYSLWSRVVHDYYRLPE